MLVALIGAFMITGMGCSEWVNMLLIIHLRAVCAGRRYGMIVNMPCLAACRLQATSWQTVSVVAKAVVIVLWVAGVHRAVSG